MVRWTALVAIALVLGSPLAATAQNCCLPDLGDDPQAVRLFDGIWWATLVLLIVPFTLVGAVALRLRAQHRRLANGPAKRARAGGSGEAT